MTDKLVSKIEELPLSGDDLVKISNSLGNSKVTWMLYDDLKKYQHPSQIFGNKYIAVFVLMQIRSDDPGKDSIGHWVCWIYHPDKDEYYWYDSYAIPISEELAITGEDRTILLLTKDIHLGDANIHKHQLFKNDVNTCGRHCALRSVFYHLDNERYHHLVIDPIVPLPVTTADILVSLITGLVSKTDQVLINFFNKKEDENITKLIASDR